MRWCIFGTDFFVCDCEKLKMYWMYIEFFGKKQAGKDVSKMCRRINQWFLKLKMKVGAAGNHKAASASDTPRAAPPACGVVRWRNMSRRGRHPATRRGSVRRSPMRLPVNTYAPAADAGGSEKVLRRAVVPQRV